MSSQQRSSIRIISQTRDYTSAVYGSVLAATVIVSSGYHRDPGSLAVLLVVSGVVFWLAHVYAATVATVHGGWRAPAVRTGLAEEWPVAAVAIPPALVALICGWLVPNGTIVAVWAALVMALVEQQVWGVISARRAELEGMVLARTFALNIAMGLVIVSLKLWLPH